MWHIQTVKYVKQEEALDRANSQKTSNNSKFGWYFKIPNTLYIYTGYIYQDFQCTGIFIFLYHSFHRGILRTPFCFPVQWPIKHLEAVAGIC